jgi:tetratricopeptide (TPR) repeat protein
LRRRLAQFVERFPQIVQVAEQMIWEEQQPEAGVGMLSTIGTPEAYAALRRFGLSQTADDQARLGALTALAEAGEIEEGETVRAWLDGEWREVELRGFEIPDDMWRESDYAPRAIETLNRGLTAFQLGNVEQAEELFERVLKLDPNVKEAYNNLGTIYARRGEHERAREMFRKALAIDPLYVFPACNLIAYLLGEERVEEAEALLAPLSEVREMHPQETAFYNFTRARILVERDEYDEAEQLLHTVLEIRPDYEMAQDLLEWIEDLDGWSYWEEQWLRDLVWRERLQERLTTLEPTLAEALPLYTKEGLTGMARGVMLSGGWSGLRKAELVDALIEALTNGADLARIVGNLSEEEQEALHTVLDRGGAMAWDAFDDRYGNDLEESRYWQWHTPETTMGRLRLHGLLVEATVDDELYIVVPMDIREGLGRV